MSADDISDIAAYYDLAVDAEDARLERHQLEHDITWRYLSRYLPPAGSVLEIGAATGRYTVPLSQLGYAVTAVDLSPALLQRCRQRLADEGLEQRAHIIVADARDLRDVPDMAFHAVLVMGPLYHLITEADRRKALEQAIDRLEHAGILVSAFLSRLGVLGDILRRTPEWIEREAEVRSHLTLGHRPDTAARGGFRGYYARVPEIRALHETLGLETVAIAGVEPAVSAHDEDYNNLQREHRAAWLDLLFEMSGDESIIGASRHILYIGRKL